MTPNAIAAAVRIIRNTQAGHLDTNGDLQRIMRDWCAEHVEGSFNRVVSELAECEDAREELDEAGLFTAYGSHEDAARAEGWHLEEDSSGDYWGVETIEWSRVRLAEHGGRWYWYLTGEEPDLLNLGDLELHDTSEEANDAALDSVGSALLAADEYDAWEELCDDKRIDREESEVYEHYAVSYWLAGALERQGEAVGKVCGWDVWGRCTTGQAVYMDSVMMACFLEYMADDVKRGGVLVGADYAMQRGTQTVRIIHRNPCASVAGDEARLFRYVGLVLDNEVRSRGTVLVNDLGECAEGNSLVI